MTFNPNTIKRLCSLPPYQGVGPRTIEACGHPILRFNLPSDHCNFCVTASLRGGFAVDVGTQANSQSDIKTRKQQ